MSARRLWRNGFARACLGVMLLACGWLAGCDAPRPGQLPPAPVELGAGTAFEATGYYCGMPLADHDGPKGQVHLESRDQPLWFSSVRDAIAFMRLPEEPRDITAVYVNDMGRARSWDEPGAGTWIDARTAWYVIDSRQRGGMGVAEAIPFSERALAQDFQSRHGGKLARLEQIPDAYVLGPVDLAPVDDDAARGNAPAFSPASSAPGRAEP